MGELLFGFDASLTHFGYAVATTASEGLRWDEVGVIVTKPMSELSKTDDNRRRVEGLALQLRGLVERHGAPTGIAVEALALPLGKTSLVTVSALGRCRGLVDALAVWHGLTACEFQPQALKRIVTGNRSAPKADVERHLVKRYPQLELLFAGLKPANREHAADACAAIHAFTQRSTHTEDT